MIKLLLYEIPDKPPTEVNLPETWEELTGEQLGRIAHALYTCTDPLVCDTLIICALVGKPIHKVDTPILFEHLLPFVDWVKKESTFTAQLLPVINMPRPYYGPSEGLFNLRFVEFHFAEIALFDWHQDKDNLFLLYRFVACIYRLPKENYDLQTNPEGDVRGLFNDNLIDQTANYFWSHMPEHLAYGIVLWYKSCRQYMMKGFPRVFNQEEKQHESDAADPPDYFSLIRNIAGKGTYGDFEKVEQMDIYLALKELESTLIDQERMQEMIENRNNQDEF